MGNPNEMESGRSTNPATVNGIPQRSNFRNGARGKSILPIWMGIARADSIITKTAPSLRCLSCISGMGLVNRNTFHSYPFTISKSF